MQETRTRDSPQRERPQEAVGGGTQGAGNGINSPTPFYHENDPPVKSGPVTADEFDKLHQQRLSVVLGLFWSAYECDDPISADMYSAEYRRLLGESIRLAIVRRQRSLPPRLPDKPTWNRWWLERCIERGTG